LTRIDLFLIFKKLLKLKDMNEDYYKDDDSNVLQESKRDYYWEQKAENFIKTGSYYDGPW
jgi:hypothetical protein|tara:strand:+ start:35 stop:214 length:180 start_codon:yes stop_codon:yes gene_type:complete